MKQKIAVLDYGIGNINSVVKALKYLEANVYFTNDKKIIESADKLILPGVSAFGAAMENLKKYDLIDIIKNHINKNKLFLGICVGLQVLFNKSEETNTINGLSIFDGSVIKFNKNLIVPHMGWNSVNYTVKHPIFNSIPDNSYFYFVHSYYVKPDNNKIISSTTEYDSIFTSSIINDNIIAVQFHPEKSQKNGLTFLKNFLKL